MLLRITLVAVALATAAAVGGVSAGAKKAPPLELQITCPAVDQSVEKALADWVLALPLPAPASGARPDGYLTQPIEIPLSEPRRETLKLINRQRARRGLRGLEPNSRLRKAATRHSRQMARKHFFSHESPGGADFGDRVRKTGYLSGSSDWILGENIGWVAPPLATPERLFRAWMKSPRHRKNILEPRFTHVGIGIARGAPKEGHPCATTYTTDFGAL